MTDDNVADRAHFFIAETGCKVNAVGGKYLPSRVISVEKYIFIVEKFEEMKAIGGTDHVSINMVAQETKVNWYTAKKVILCHEAGIGYEGMDMGKFCQSKIGDRLNLDIDNKSHLLWLV